MIRMSAACGCDRGKVRSGNQDNFYFRGNCLEETNNGLEAPLEFSGWQRSGMMLAVFDGMGGENYGETASFTAATTMDTLRKGWSQRTMDDRQFLCGCVETLNAAVVQAQERLHTRRMGTTVTALYLGAKHMYIWNVGDSRCYLLRDGTLKQCSVDHVGSLLRPGERKAPLTQYLGLDPEELSIVPAVSCEELRRGDRYLLCSDGVTDMLSDEQIKAALSDGTSCTDCVKTLISGALEQGGKDNITAIVCQIA